MNEDIFIYATLAVCLLALLGSMWMDFQFTKLIRKKNGE